MCSIKKIITLKNPLAVLLICSLIFPFQLTLNVKAAGTDDITIDNSFTFSESEINVAESGSGYKIDGTELTINAAGTYRITGTCSEGSIVVKKGTTGVTLILEDLTLTSSETAPIIAKKETETEIILKGTTILTDNENPDNENSEDEEIADAFEGACIKAKSGSTLTISGDGTLFIYGNAKNGIKGASLTNIIINSGIIDMYAANNGIASDDLVTINGGTITISSGDDAIHAEYNTNIGIEGSTEGPEITITKCVEGIEGATVNLYAGSADYRFLSSVRKCIHEWGTNERWIWRICGSADTAKWYRK